MGTLSECPTDAAIACELYDLIDLGTMLLDWHSANPEGQQHIAAVQRLLGHGTPSYTVESQYHG